MGPYNGPSHAYGGSVEYPSAESFRSSTNSSHRVASHTTRSRDDRFRMTASQEQRTSVRETSVHFQSDAYTTDSHTSSREAVGLHAHYSTSSTREAAPRHQPRYPARQGLQMSPITRVESSSRTSPEPPRPHTTRRPRNDLIQSQADDLLIEAIERALAPSVQPGNIVRQWYRDWRSLPPRYQDSSYHTEYLPRLMAGYFRYDFGPTLEDNMRALKDRVRPEYWAELAVMLRADSMGTRDEAPVRRVLIRLDSLPPENEDADPVPLYEERWEAQYNERFGYARIPAYEA